MSAKYFIPLQEIDKAIRINSQIDHKALKSLTLAKEGAKNQGVARRVFIYVALKVGYEPEVICDFLAITPTEFENKKKDLGTYYGKGKTLFKRHNLNADDFDEGCLLFYRKLILVCNYLRFRYDFDV